jgi:hypothetical protein
MESVHSLVILFLCSFVNLQGLLIVKILVRLQFPFRRLLWLHYHNIRRYDYNELCILNGEGNPFLG